MAALTTDTETVNARKQGVRARAAHTSFLVFVITTGICAVLALALSARKQYIFLELVGVILAYLTIFIVILNVIFRVEIKNKIVRDIALIGVTSVSIFLLLFVITCMWIGFYVKTQCQDARREYGGDCVNALTSLLNDKNRGFRARNSAIWALGQLGDSRALPTLQRYHTVNMPPREPLDEVISQYELNKAINLTSGGNNLTAIFWRHSIDK